MRVVIDTNVFVSAALKESSWPAIAVRWVDSYGVLLKSLGTEQELMQVLQRPRFAPKILPLFTANLERMFAAAELVTITEQVAACRDPKDDKFLELAVNGRADVILSGDADLLVLGLFHDIPILDPATFGRSRFP
jgi:putative PIN family toxin of toxin-antitoxin system